MFDYEGSTPAELLIRVRAAHRDVAKAEAARLVEVHAFEKACLGTFDEAALAIVDTHDAIAAELGAALGRTVRYGHKLISLADAMHTRLPLTGAVFAAGDIDYLTFQTIVRRTDLISDPDILAAVDARIAAAAARWSGFGEKRLHAAIDAIVFPRDPDAVSDRTNGDLTERAVLFTENRAGFAEIHGTLFATTAAALEKKLSALAATVCAQDGRTVDARRADAFDALTAGADRMACGCGRGSQCPAGPAPRKSSNTVVHVVGETTPDGTWEPGYLMGSDELIPPQIMAELARTANLRPLEMPDGQWTAETGYQPSRKLCDLVRARDLTCRVPGCTVPATRCEIDHTIPRDQGGPHHPSNLKCLCTFHHIVKTFWRWRDEQLPDGTVIWRTPAGQTYVSLPASMVLFPRLCAPTGWIPHPDQPITRHGPNHPKMPKRAKTRKDDRAYRVALERQHNRHHRITRSQTAQTDTGADDPPPF